MTVWTLTRDDATDSIKSITQQALLMQAVAEKMGFGATPTR